MIAVLVKRRTPFKTVALLSLDCRRWGWGDPDISIRTPTQLSLASDGLVHRLAFERKPPLQRTQGIRAQSGAPACFGDLVYACEAMFTRRASAHAAHRPGLDERDDVTMRVANLAADANKAWAISTLRTPGLQ